MKLTRRGWSLTIVIIVAIAAATAFGPRGLNAVVAPGILVILAGAIQIYRTTPVSVTRSLPSRAPRGDVITIRVQLQTHRPFSALVTDEIPNSFSATDNTRHVTINETTLQYELELTERGEHHIGPTRIRAQDVLGLVEKSITVSETDSILVRPRVYLLGGPRRDDLVQLYGESGDDRQQFNQLRLYRRGDPVRDIHWKSSAKQPNSTLVVKEFAADEGTRTVEIAAGAKPECADLMADATASIAMHLLEAGVRVGVTTPSGRVSPSESTDQRRQILDHLARAGHGAIDDRNDPHVIVNSTRTELYVDIEGRRGSFSELVGGGIDREAIEPTQPITVARQISESIS